MNGTGIQRRSDKYRISIKWKLLVIIMIFIMCVLLSTWFFQVGMLNFFYQNATFQDLDASADSIAALLSDEVDAKNRAHENSREYHFDIWLLKISDKTGTVIFGENGSGGEYLPFITNKMEIVYEQAKRNSGTYIATIPLDESKESFEFKVLKDNSGRGDMFPDITNYSGHIGTLHGRIVNVDGQEYMILQYANLTPLNSIFTMLEQQTLLIGVAMCVFVFLLVAILSKFITKPIVSLNETAKQLAAGNYDADFSARGYREIEELTATLNYASRELSKNDRLQKELISNVSHDLRTPLTMIKGYSEVMRDIPGENTPENIQVIIDETTRLSELVNDMLDLSKIQSGTRTLQKEAFSITQTVRDTLHRYEKLIMQDGYNIEFQAEDDVSVIADRSMILQVVYNLINNAINYTGENKCVKVVQSVSVDRVRISVTDTGEGISAEDMGEIWERYYRVDKVHKRATIGTGLGLSIVKGVLEAHGASFGVDSIPGNGATFWFELERAPEPYAFDAQYDNDINGEL